MELVRNGYYYNLTSASMTQLEMELWVYTGTQTTSRPGTVTANLLTSTYAGIGGTSPMAMINIANHINDQMDIKYSTNLSTLNAHDKGVWFDYRTRSIVSGTPGSWNATVELFGVPGYGSYLVAATKPAVGNNPILISRGEPNQSKYPVIYVPEGERLVLPFSDWDDSGSLDEGTFYNGTTHTTGVATPGNATTSVGAVVYVQEPVALDSTGTYQFLDPTYLQLHKIERVNDYKNDAQKIVFLNAFGVWQEMWFFGRHTLGFSTEGITAKRDTKFYATFDRNQHQYIDFSKQGRESLTLNSGWQVEVNNVFFRELLMSEKVYWVTTINNGTYQIPVRVKTSSMQMKTELWDKMINYTIEFEHGTDYTI